MPATKASALRAAPQHDQRFSVERRLYRGVGYAAPGNITSKPQILIAEQLSPDHGMNPVRADQQIATLLRAVGKERENHRIGPE
jgi:hypothetical protein